MAHAVVWRQETRLPWLTLISRARAAQRALCIYHPRDEVINLRLSSLYLELHQRYGAQEMQR